MKIRHLNYEILPIVPTRMDFGGSYTKWSQQHRKKLAEDVPLGKILKRNKGK